MTQKTKNKDEEILSDNIIRSPHKKRNNLSMRKKDNLDEGIKLWVSMWRCNIARFAVDYLGLDLFPFQMILLHLMNLMYSSCLVCSRGLSKSYMTAIFCVCRCILFPQQKIVISCVTKSQARNLVEGKIVNELMVKSPTLRQEIAYNGVKLGANDCSITFKNGSIIKAVNCSDNTRGLRANILVVDEYRMIEGFDTLNQILKPFLNCVRIPKFKSREDGKYNDYPVEENMEIYLSSALIY